MPVWLTAGVISLMLATAAAAVDAPRAAQTPALGTPDASQPAAATHRKGLPHKPRSGACGAAGPTPMRRILSR